MQSCAEMRVVRGSFHSMIIHFPHFFFQVEYMIVKIDDKEKTAKVSLRADTLLPKLQEQELANPTYVPDTLASGQVLRDLDRRILIFFCFVG